MKTIAALEDGIAANDDGYTHEVFVWNEVDGKLLRTIDYGKDFTVAGLLFSPPSSKQLEVTVTDTK